MDPTRRFSSRAEKYARYRWGYAPQAAQAIFDHAHLPNTAAVADIGSGTGLLTRHFLDRACCVYAVEPNPEMRRQAELSLGAHPAFISVDGRSEATTLSNQSIDLITVAQAIGWFEPGPARQEFQRILKPGGWLAILHNELCDSALEEAMQPLYAEEFGYETAPATPPASQALQGDERLRFYFGTSPIIQLSFPQSLLETWEAFFGAQCSVSYAPDETHPRFAAFAALARRIFDRFAHAGQIKLTFSTELAFGQPGQPG